MSRIPARHQIPHLSLLDPMTGELIRASKTTTVRYERDRPGELVHMDVKKLGKIPAGGGWQADGGTRRNHRTNPDKTPIGYDYVHSLVDDHSRWPTPRSCPTRKARPWSGEAPQASCRERPVR